MNSEIRASTLAIKYKIEVQQRSVASEIVPTISSRLTSVGHGYGM